MTSTQVFCKKVTLLNWKIGWLASFYNCQRILVDYFTIRCAGGHLCTNGQCLLGSWVGQVSVQQAVPKRVFLKIFFFSVVSNLWSSTICVHLFGLLRSLGKCTQNKRGHYKNLNRIASSNFSSTLSCRTLERFDDLGL